MIWFPGKGNCWSPGCLEEQGKAWGQKGKAMARNEAQGKVRSQTREPAGLSRKGRRPGLSLPYRPPLSQPLLWNIPEVDLYFSPWIWAGQGWVEGLQEKQRETEAVAEPPALSVGLAIAECGAALHTPDLIHPLNRLGSELQLYGRRNWVTVRSGNWLRSHGLKVAGPGVKPRGTYLQNLNLDI